MSNGTDWTTPYIIQNPTISFKNSLLKIGRPMPKPTFNIHNPLGLKLLRCLRLELSHLNENRFNHNSEVCINPLRVYSALFPALP